MENLTQQYNDALERRNEVITQLQELEENPFVQKYIRLWKENNTLVSSMENLYNSMKLEEYETCNHVGVLCKEYFDTYGGRTYGTYGCIKCGLNQAMASGERLYETRDEIAMIQYFKKHRYMDFEEIEDVACDLELATAITRKIREAHPDISDEDLVKYFKKTLKNIRKTNASEAIKKSRIQKLSLRPNFQNWEEEDIES